MSDGNIFASNEVILRLGRLVVVDGETSRGLYVGGRGRGRRRPYLVGDLEGEDLDRGNEFLNVCSSTVALSDGSSVERTEGPTPMGETVLEVAMTS